MIFSVLGSKMLIVLLVLCNVTLAGLKLLLKLGYVLIELWDVDVWLVTDELFSDAELYMQAFQDAFNSNEESDFSNIFRILWKL